MEYKEFWERRDTTTTGTMKDDHMYDAKMKVSQRGRNNR